jgi:hypothetical protein
MKPEKKRVQFSLPDGERVFAYLTGLEHDRWPVRQGASKWTRVALQVLHEYQRAKTRREPWYGPDDVAIELADLRRPSMERGSRRAAPATALKVDIWLHEAELQQVDAWVRDGVADTPSKVLLLAVQFLATLASHFAKGQGGVVAATGRGSKRRAPVDLKRLVGERRARSQPPPQLKLTVRGDPSSSGAELKVKPLISSTTRTFFAAIWFTSAFNRWLATEVERVTQAAEKKVKESDQRARRVVAQRENDLWETELDINSLLEQFWEREQPRGEHQAGPALSHELAANALLLEQWRPVGEAIQDQAALGYQVMRNYLDHRFGRLHPYVGAQRAAPAQPTTTRWRGWTRSLISDGYREIAAPLEWTAVVHHALCSRPRGTSALVSHDLQTLLVDALGVRNAKHHRMLADACAAFNHALTTAANNERFVPLEDAMRWLTVAGPDKEAIASLSYLYLCLTRVVQPTYRWKVAGEGQAKLPSLDLSRVQRGMRSLASADFSELRARIFGAQTTIGGLHWVLHGGIVPRPRSGRVTVIYGQAGSGKSTFGLALAADMARRGRVSIRPVLRRARGDRQRTSADVRTARPPALRRGYTRRAQGAAARRGAGRAPKAQARQSAE